MIKFTFQKNSSECILTANKRTNISNRPRSFWTRSDSFDKATFDLSFAIFLPYPQRRPVRRDTALQSCKSSNCWVVTITSGVARGGGTAGHPPVSRKTKFFLLERVFLFRTAKIPNFSRAYRHRRRIFSLKFSNFQAKIDKILTKSPKISPNIFAAK